MRRTVTPERMDEPDVSESDLRASLEFIRMINARFGGVRALVDRLDDWSPPDDSQAGTPVRILDIGTGSADIPVAALRWAERRGVLAHVVAVDLHPVTLRLAGEYVRDELGADALAPDRESLPDARSTIALVEADALRLMDLFEPRSFDVVHAGMFIHHLQEIQALTVLRIMDRLADRGMVWNDLVRSEVALLGARVLTARQPAIVKHDATVSVRAGFTPQEARVMLRRAGWPSPTVRSSFLHQRFVAIGEKWGGSGGRP